jgi:hypothetical protein
MKFLLGSQSIELACCEDVRGFSPAIEQIQPFSRQGLIAPGLRWRIKAIITEVPEMLISRR